MGAAGVFRIRMNAGLKPTPSIALGKAAPQMKSSVPIGRATRSQPTWP